MQVLPNGQVQITNNQTGETRVVDPGQLGSFSPLLANQYFAYQTMQKSLNKGSGGAGGATDTLQGPALGTSSGGVANTNQGSPYGNGNDLLNKKMKPGGKQNSPPPPVNISSGVNLLNNTMGGVNMMGQASTPYTNPIQQPQQPKPQAPQGLSTFDISKVRF